MKEQKRMEPHRGDDGKLYLDGHWVELYDGKYLPVVNPDRTGWWRFHEHYDRDGYCDQSGKRLLED